MPDEHQSESGRYWKQHLLSWEASAYYRDLERKAGWWDRLSTVFRGNAMYIRMQTALELLAPHLGGMTVMDVGCASGRFPFQLVRAGAAKVTGIDISPEAIALAQKNAIDSNLASQTDFLVEDLIHPARRLPQVDVVTALGVIEYFDPTAMEKFLKNLQTRYIFLDFPDRSRSREFPTWPLRQVYIRVNRLPGVYLYSLEQFCRIAEPLGFRDIHLVKKNNFFYVTNLPVS